MIRLIPGTPPLQAADALHEAARDLADIRGRALTALSRYYEYQRWAARQVRNLVGRIHSSDVDHLIVTPWRWALSPHDPNLGEDTIAQFIDVQISDTIERLQAEVQKIKEELARWHDCDAVAAVLDTNIVLNHVDEIQTMDWNSILDIRPPTPIVLAVSQIVVDELDNLKLSNSKPSRPGQQSVRERARNALRKLEGWLSDPHRRVELGYTPSPHSFVDSRLELALIRQELDHASLPHADSEIVDRALSLRGFARDVHVISFDTGMLLRARQAGLSAHTPRENPER